MLILAGTVLVTNNQSHTARAAARLGGVEGAAVGAAGGRLLGVLAGWGV